MRYFQGIFRIVVETALFAFALLQGAAAYFWMLDRHRAIEKAKREGGVIPTSKFPVIPTILAIGALLAITLGFWMVFHPPVVAQSAPTAPPKSGANSVPDSPPKSAALDSQPKPHTRERLSSPQGKPNLNKGPLEKGANEPTQVTPAPAIATRPNVRVDAPNNQGNVAGNNFGTQTFNQYGAPKLVMSVTQQEAITAAMRPYPGIKVTIFCHDATQDSFMFAQRLALALRAARIDVPEPGVGTLYRASPVPSGFSVIFGEDMKPAVMALAKAMVDSDLLTPPISGGPEPNFAGRIEITIAPNR